MPSGSVIGSASMSALNATTGLPLPSVATIPLMAYGYLHRHKVVANAQPVSFLEDALVLCKRGSTLVWDVEQVQVAPQRC